MIIKPVHEGSSVGMSNIEKAEDFAAAIEKATQHDAVVMAEKWITGREFTISFLNGQPLPVIRLQPPADVAFYDYEAKYQRNDVEYGIPCGLSEDEEKSLQALCLRAFQAVGAEGWGRIDAMQDEQGNFWLLEVNTVPGMTSHSLVPKAAQAIGYSFDQLCVAIFRANFNPIGLMIYVFNSLLLCAVKHGQPLARFMRNRLHRNKNGECGWLGVVDHCFYCIGNWSIWLI